MATSCLTRVTAHPSKYTVIILMFSWICEADVELFVQEESEYPAICGRCTTFTCIANDTNIVEITQNDTLCQTFERDSKLQGPGECNNLELALINATVDPNNEFLTIFVIEGKQCFQGERNAINIKCADATMSSKSLQLGVDSGTCSQNVMCHKENCSECIEEGFEIEWSFLQCPGFETVTNYSLSISPGEENITISEKRYCKCETEQQFEIEISGVNQCGETTVISSTCENEPSPSTEFNAAVKCITTLPLIILLAATSVPYILLCSD